MPATTHHQPSPYQKITPTQHFFDFGLDELWQQRQLLLVLVKRDLQVRYKNTWLGIFWVVLQPVLSTLIFTLIFANVFKFTISNVNYMTYTLIGFIFWQFFSSSITYASTSMYEQIGLIKKIYFPRLFIPLTVILRHLFDFFVSSIFLIIVMLINHVPLTGTGLLGFLLALSVLTILTSGLSFFFSSLNARFRDFRHLIPFVIQIWFYATPVFYATSLLSGKLAFLAVINPVTQILILARNAIFYQVLDLPTLGILLLVSVVVFILGLGFFKTMESQVVDWT